MIGDYYFFLQTTVDYFLFPWKLFLTNFGLWGEEWCETRSIDKQQHTRQTNKMTLIQMSKYALPWTKNCPHNLQHSLKKVSKGKSCLIFKHKSLTFINLITLRMNRVSIYLSILDYFHTQQLSTLNGTNDRIFRWSLECNVCMLCMPCYKSFPIPKYPKRY